MKYRIVAILVLVFCLGVSADAFAYVGPGAGLSLLGALWGLIAAVGAALGFVIMWPVRRLFKRSRKTRANAPGDAVGERDKVPTSTEQHGQGAMAETDAEQRRRRA